MVKTPGWCPEKRGREACQQAAPDAALANRATFPELNRFEVHGDKDALLATCAERDRAHRGGAAGPGGIPWRQRQTRRHADVGQWHRRRVLPHRARAASLRCATEMRHTAIRRPV